jgi:chromate transporter
MQNIAITPELKTDKRGRVRPKGLRELSLLYLRLGTTAFGGPAAHIAIMEHEVVQRRRWLNREEFLDFLGIVNLIPGPSSTEMAIQIGYGWRVGRGCSWEGCVSSFRRQF